MIKCEVVVKEYWRDLYPHLASLDSYSVCPPLWDGMSCLPPTPAGDQAVLPCGDQPSQGNATRECLINGSWSHITDYSQCQEPLDQVTAISLAIYAVGYSLSLLALLISVLVFLSFRELKCLRHKIHLGLFISFALSAFNWIVINILLELQHLSSPVFLSVLCTSWVLASASHLASFYWMFLEGFYLFLQVQFPLSLTAVKYKHFLLSGWGIPAINILVWMLLRMVQHFSTSSATSSTTTTSIHSCPFFAKSDLDYVYEVPSCIILICNIFFLIWIILVVMSKLRQQAVLEHDRRHYKAAKALICVTPLLGLGYLLTLIPPHKENSFYNVFQIGRSVLLSSQGLLISFTYCFLNDEVQAVLMRHWRRQQLVRRVGREGRQRRATLTTSLQISYCDPSQ